MKKSKKVLKITAGLVACIAAFVMVLAGNPIKTEAGWWSCAWNGHKLYTYYIPSNCQNYGYAVSTCDCGRYYYKFTNYEAGLGTHVYSTNPREVPTCLYCGCTK